MVDTFTPNLRLRKPEVGANDGLWAPLINTDLVDLIEAAIAGESVVDVTAGNVALTEVNGGADTSRAMFLRVTGTPGVTRTVTTTTTPKLYVVKNDSNASVIIAPAAGATTLTILSGRSTMVYVDPGVGVFEVTTSGSYVAAATAAMTAITLDIDISIAGDTTTTLWYHRQGAMVYAIIDNFLTGNTSGTAFTFSPNAGSWPTDLVPAFTQDFYIGVIDNAVYNLCRLQITPSLTGTWTLTKEDNSIWNGPVINSPYDMALAYFVTSF